MGDMEQHLNGVIERVTYHNAETGFAVLRVVARGRRGLVTVVGTLASANPGEHVEAVGQWVQDRNHGEQFKAACPSRRNPPPRRPLRRGSRSRRSR